MQTIQSNSPCNGFAPIEGEGGSSTKCIYFVPLTPPPPFISKLSFVQNNLEINSYMLSAKNTPPVLKSLIGIPEPTGKYIFGLKNGQENPQFN
jgi:hypothetical protein